MGGVYSMPVPWSSGWKVGSATCQPLCTSGQRVGCATCPMEECFVRLSRVRLGVVPTVTFVDSINKNHLC